VLCLAGRGCIYKISDKVRNCSDISIISLNSRTISPQITVQVAVPLFDKFGIMR
jgi:hypothetical protein